jgi:hypothetical protein
VVDAADMLDGPARGNGVASRPSGQSLEPALTRKGMSEGINWESGSSRLRTEASRGPPAAPLPVPVAVPVRCSGGGLAWHWKLQLLAVG